MEKGTVICWIIVVLAFVGWFMNIAKLMNTNSVGMAIARGIGIFLAPLGAVLGYL